MSETLIQAGSKARLLVDEPDLTTGQTRRKGFEFVVEDYVSAEQAEDGMAFYWGSSGGGCNNVAVPACSVEVAMTAEAMAARKLPSKAEFAQEISGDLCGLDGDLVTTDETEVDANQVMVYGETHEGLRFAARVVVVEVEHADF